MITLWPQIRAEVAEALSQTSRDLLGVFPVVEVATEERDTERVELAAGKCQGAWRNYPHVHLREDPTVYRQHRCGREVLHRGTCRCRYCGKDRSAA